MLRLGPIGCATALPLLAAPSALASTVEVVRLDRAGNLSAAAGELVTPAVSSGPPGPDGTSPVFAPENGAALEIGPIFAEVDFYSRLLHEIPVDPADSGLILFGAQSVGPGLSGSNPFGAGSAFPGSAEPATGTLDGNTNSNAGTLEGNTNSGATGTIEGAVPGTSVITIEGTLTGPTPVPIPGAAGLFATGVSALAAGWFRRRRKQ